MIAMLSGVGSRIWAIGAAILAGIWGVLLILSRAKKAGRDEERAKGLVQREHNREKRDEVDRETIRQPDGAASDRLRSDWSRD
jgi:hypothetical protein